MSDLRELYQELILDHGRAPRFHHKPEVFSHDCEAYNPLCGDRVHLYLKIEDDSIVDKGFVGHGCAISMAATSLMLEALSQCRETSEAKELFLNFKNMLTHSHFDEEKLGKLLFLQGVKEYPSRIKCALLAWHALDSLLHNKSSTTI